MMALRSKTSSATGEVHGDPSSQQAGVDEIALRHLAKALTAIDVGLDRCGFELRGIFAHGEHPKSQDWCPTFGGQFNLWERIHSRCGVSVIRNVGCAGLSRMNSLLQ